MDSYTVYKHTATHADVLAAIGAADVLRHLDPRLVEFEDRFEIQFRKTLLPSDLDAVDPGFSYLERPQKKTPSIPPERRATPAENRMYSILGRMKAFGGPNLLVSQFAKMKREEWSRRVWDGFNGGGDFAFASPLVQLFNPQSAKGYALLKPTGTNRSDRSKDRWAEPFLEWLRFRGYFECGSAWYAEGDLRFYCPVPGDIPYESFASAAAALRQFRLGGTAVKMDCRAMLGLTRLLIEESPAHRPPRQSVRGLWITHYKDMGQAHTFMATEQLATPDWFELRNADDAAQWLRTIEEHDTVLRRLTDSHSDEFELLKQYRRTFQRDVKSSVAEFAEFLMGYALLLFKRRVQDHWVLPQFSAASVESILNRDPDYAQAICNPGFQAVAAAIRSATVAAQAVRHNQRADHRELRYGLLGDLRRAGLLGRAQLLQATSAFVAQFNVESVRRRSAGIASMQIQDTELASFASLLEKLPRHVPAAALLCGISSCMPANAAAEAKRDLARVISA